ncbi:MAG: HpcH/HpaI aldolase/citrate lyase family protein [Vicinamibacterales bacterium]
MNPSLKRALRNRERVIGGWLMFGHTGIAEIMVQAGFDWITIDLEHSVIGIETVQSLVQVIDLAGGCPLVRVTSNDADLIKRVMDAGAHGVIVPMVNSASEAHRAVAAVKYPPDGARGVGLGRAHAYGARFDGYFSSANRESIVILQIEHRDAVLALESIVEVPGVDGIIVGPYDLSCSIGQPGKFDHPDVLAAERRIVEVAAARGVAAGLHVVTPSPEGVKRAWERGYSFAAYGADMLFLTWSCRAAMETLRAPEPSR